MVSNPKTNSIVLLSKQKGRLFDISNIFYIFFVFVPITIVLDVFFSINSTILFVLSVLSIIPLAKLVGDTTEHLAEHYGNTGGSLINVTFSNTPEIILSIIAIQAGLFDLVRANIVGSILGQILVVFGLSLIVGGLKFKEQKFNRQNIVFHTTALLMALGILSIPTILIFGNFGSVDTNSSNQTANNNYMVMVLGSSFAVLLLAIYFLGLIFTFKTHRHLFSFQTTDTEEEGQTRLSEQENLTIKAPSPDTIQMWSKKKAIGLLAISMIGIAIISEILVGSVEDTITHLDLSVLFVGAIVIGIVGNIPEKITSMMMARKGKLDLSLGIAVSSASQIALFVLPLIVIAAVIMGISFPLIFTPFELITMFAGTILLYFITQSGRGNWFQGVILLGFFIAIAFGFYFIK